MSFRPLVDIFTFALLALATLVGLIFPALTGSQSEAAPVLKSTPAPATVFVADPGKSALVAADVNRDTAPTYSNVGYAACSGDCSDQQLDIYLPTVNEPVGVIVWFHGGGFYSGDKADPTHHGLVMSQLNRGWIIVSANYRMAEANDQNSSTRLMDDVMAATAWAISDAPQAYGVPSGLPTVTAGHSAGGTLAAMAALQMPTGTIDGWVSVSGILDWSAGPLSAHWANTLHQGAQFGLAPVDLFSADSPPGYLIHGANDPIVEVANARAAKKAADRAGSTLHIDIVDTSVDGASLGEARHHVPFGGANAGSFNLWVDSARDGAVGDGDAQGGPTLFDGAARSFSFNA